MLCRILRSKPSGLTHARKFATDHKKSLVPATKKLKEQPKNILAKLQPLAIFLKNKIGLSSKPKVPEDEDKRVAEYEDETLDEYALEKKDGSIIIDTKAKYWYQKWSDRGKAHREKLYDRMVDYINDNSTKDKTQNRSEGVIMKEIRRILKGVIHRILAIVVKIIVLYHLGKLMPRLAVWGLVKRYKQRIVKEQNTS